MSAIGTEKHPLKVFKGDQKDWPDWKVKFQGLLRHYGLRDTLKRGVAQRSSRETSEMQLSTPKKESLTSTQKPPVVEIKKVSAASEEDTKNNQNIYGKLVMFTEGAPFAIVSQFDDEEDGVGAWLALVEKYELKGTVQNAILQDREDLAEAG